MPSYEAPEDEDTTELQFCDRNKQSQGPPWPVLILKGVDLIYKPSYFHTRPTTPHRQLCYCFP